MDAVEALAKGEAQMTVKVIKKDGTEEIHQGLPVAFTVDKDLILRYKSLLKEIQEVEQEILKQINGE